MVQPQRRWCCNESSSWQACMSISTMSPFVHFDAACCCALQPPSCDCVQGAQCSDQLAAAAEDAADAIERFEGVAAPANGSVHVQQGAEPPDFAAALQLPPSFQPEPCSAYDADFAVSCCVAARVKRRSCRPQLLICTYSLLGEHFKNIRAVVAAWHCILLPFVAAHRAPRRTAGRQPSQGQAHRVCPSSVTSMH